MRLALFVALFSLLICVHGMVQVKVRRKRKDFRTTSNATERSYFNSEESISNTVVKDGETVFIKPVLGSNISSPRNSNTIISRLHTSTDAVEYVKQKKNMRSNMTSSAVGKGIGVERNNSAVTIEYAKQKKNMRSNITSSAVGKGIGVERSNSAVTIESAKQKKNMRSNITSNAVGKGMRLEMRNSTTSTRTFESSKSIGTSVPLNVTINSSKPAIDHIYIFVGGTHFSGTSITERLLSSQTFATGIRADMRSVNDTSGCHLVDPVDPHRCIVPENEGGFLTKEMTKIYFKTKRYCTVAPFYEWGRCAATYHLTELDVSYAEGGAQGVYKRLMNDWSMWWNMDRRYLVEKDIPNMVQSRFLQTIFGRDTTYFIFMLRHPLASCKYFECNITSLIEAWLMANDVMSSDLPYVKNYMVIHHDSMNLNSSGTVNAIRKFLGWSELNYIDKSNKLNFKIDRWSVDMTLNPRRSLYFHGATEFPEDYNVTIQNHESNAIWSHIYPKMISTYHVNISRYEIYLNKYCYSVKKLEPICKNPIWKQSL